MSQLDVVILRALRAANGASIRESFLATEAKVNRTEISARLDELRGAGYQIEKANDSCRLVGTPDRLTADDLRGALGHCLIGNRIIVVEETRSTNDFILQLIKPELAEGFVVFAERQTAGRGQRANRWESAAHKGLWLSIFLRPRISLAESPRLTTWAAENVAGTVEKELALRPTIKVPNDVYIDDGKIAGVLIEMRAEADFGHVAIAGIGINVNHTREDFSEQLQGRAGSLAMAAGRRVNRYDLAVALLRNLNRSYIETFRS
jgi:BirA family transcriptional regulator, biotin operon repressor / biotin---[acetyl-CoA-carboxylase] ligase